MTGRDAGTSGWGSWTSGAGGMRSANDPWAMPVGESALEVADEELSSLPVEGRVGAMDDDEALPGSQFGAHPEPAVGPSPEQGGCRHDGDAEGSELKAASERADCHEPKAHARHRRPCRRSTS